MRNSSLILPLLSFSLFAQAQQQAFQEQLQEAGALSQQINQQPSRLAKPTGQLFNQPIKIHQQNADMLRFELKQITIKLFNQDGLQEPIQQDLSFLLKPYLNRPITLADLNQLTDQITQYYRKNNYLVARAFIPPQEIENGQLIIGLIEGNIGKITIDNQSRLSEKFVRRMANTSVNSLPYLAQNEVEKLALLLNGIQGVSSKLSIQAGEQAGTTNMNILLQNSKSWKAYLFADNQGSAQTGEYRLSGGIKGFNLAGLGDELNLNMLSSYNGKLRNAQIDYSALLDGYGTRLGAFFSYLDYKLGKSFAALGAKGNNQNMGIYLLHPTIRMPNLHINTKLTLSHNRILDSQSQPQSIENLTKINLFSFDMNGVWNSFAKGTTYFNLGVSIGKQHNRSTEAMHNRALDWKENNKFTLTNIELGHEQLLPYDFAIDLNVKAQMTDRNLSPSQKMLLGGQNAVRGYRTGALSLADAVVGQFSLKHYYPVLKESLVTSSIFYDIGAGRKYHNIDRYEQRPEETNQVKLQSIGTGIQLSAPNDYALTFYYSKPIGKKLVGEKDHQLMLSLLKMF